MLESVALAIHPWICRRWVCLSSRTPGNSSELSTSVHALKETLVVSRMEFRSFHKLNVSNSTSIPV